MVNWNEQVLRDRAWNAARADLIANGMAETEQWQRCVKFGTPQEMPEECWADVKTAFPPT